jgi:hypothetical protein
VRQLRARRGFPALVPRGQLAGSCPPGVLHVAHCMPIAALKINPECELQGEAAAPESDGGRQTPR